MAPPILGYNDAAQLASVELPDTSTYAYTYNDAGDVETRTYPAAGTIAYGYDDDGLIDTQTSDSLTTTYTYDPDFHLTQIEYPGTTDIVENRGYDRAGRITEVTTLDTSGPTLIDEFTYSRDPNGNPTHIARTRGATTDDTAYTYDDRNWLTKECIGANTCVSATDYVAYTYDDTGNRLQMDRVGSVPDPGTLDYTYDEADQLTTLDDGTTPVTLDYDADGNLLTGGRVWNALNQMTASNVPGTSATTYAYDALGNRITSTTGSDTTELSWDINNPLPMLAVTTDPADDPTAYRYTPTGELLQSEHPRSPTPGPSTPTMRSDPSSTRSRPTGHRQPSPPTTPSVSPRTPP